MKKLILAAFITACGLSVLAQGTVNFITRTAFGSSHVWIGSYDYQGNGTNDIPAGAFDYAAHGFHLIGANGNTGEASHYFAQLLGAPGTGVPESGLLPGTPTTTFRTGIAAGNVFPTTETFNNIPLDAPIGTFELVVWDNSSGNYPTWTQASPAWYAGVILAGRSAPFVIQNIGGSTNSPPTPEPGLQSFGFGTPEPSTVALAGLGAAMFLFRRRK